MYRCRSKARLLASVAVLAALMLGGCQSAQFGTATGSVGETAPAADGDWRREAQIWGERYDSPLWEGREDGRAGLVGGERPAEEGCFGDARKNEVLRRSEEATMTFVTNQQMELTHGIWHTPEDQGSAQARVRHRVGTTPSVKGGKQ